MNMYIYSFFFVLNAYTSFDTPTFMRRVVVLKKNHNNTNSKKIVPFVFFFIF